MIQGEKSYQLTRLGLESGESIETTAEHPFYIKGKGWQPASSLKVGEALQLHNGVVVVIKTIDTSVRFEKVYNLTVANTHNYFVGDDGALVHNCIDYNKLHHIFGKADHRLDNFLSQFDSQEAAFLALEKAGLNAARGRADGVHNIRVKIGSVFVTIRVYIKNGKARLSTAYIADGD
ncbi:Hint domain-containing protein [Candidatus Albibeggiatoa sp. nov. BB20]|uniref:Hint domain-containing protein n=1 Tax=Candidatus Albibeggiatoa sp. nov. BB20 TaxID=3162723 RepID=UPI003365367C